jgi:8-oxo-dGTP pyrophosphatase MutT (NUDIX family)
VIEPSILPAIRARLDRAQTLPPLRYRPVVVGDAPLGSIDDVRAARLAQFHGVFSVTDSVVALRAHLQSSDERSSAMSDVARTLRAEGALPAWRNELYAIATAFESPPLFHLERGAARYFGFRTWAAHVNGIVRDDDEVRMWFARRSTSKAVDPGLLDNLVGGGIAAGLSPAETVVKEAWEEAGIDRQLAARAVPCGALDVERAMFDGLQRETIYVYDLALATDFTPINQDGEASEYHLASLEEAARWIAEASGPHLTTVESSLVALDYLERSGAFDA